MPRGFLVKRSRRGCHRSFPAPEKPPGPLPRALPPPPPPPLPFPPQPPPKRPLPPPPPPRSKAPLPKKQKSGSAARRLSFADEVTTSPVLGLRIKAASEEEEGGRGRAPGPSSSSLLLGGQFVCQLCKEPYGDPLALAQHRCSRIVRVEYRCPECHKVFSCPANLASHRRWHKPRPLAGAATPGKENGAQQPGAAEGACCKDPASCPEASSLQGSSPSPSSSVGELFLCPYCRKAFRRQAYLRKHLGTHQPGPPPGPPQPLGFPCPFCGAPFPSADLRDKHRLWHAAAAAAAVREELLLPLGGRGAQAQQPPGETAGGAQPVQLQQPQQIFSCKHCPATFFSSPGLTRHINKCHPSENRQVLLLQMPLRPGC
ncbi:insulinoma-associated protein 2 [Sceloporus undulatus]|uniref:insulinoma-associated protein 2 n=1 Tax=Sceloporus undulatus TaxID=8520 RepID=UPI001C4CEF4F|nr:insulinoma-associated protein 2 [Sceloporus undulatus]